MKHKLVTRSKTVATESQRKALSTKYSSPQAPIHPVLQLQKTIGNQAVNHLVQGNLKVGQADDRYEQEADRIANAVLQKPDSLVQNQLLPRKVNPITHHTELALQRQPRRSVPRLRLPTLETFSALSGGSFASQGRGLTGDEQNDAVSVFGSSINLDAVRIVETPIVNAPTTLGNYIRVSPGERIPRHVLIHELAHIWQFQTKGTAYISDSLWHQAVATIATGSRSAAYQVNIVPGQSIHDYTAEQQAVIIENYFVDSAKRSDPEYQKMIGEVRRARPIPQSLILEEAALGPAMGSERLRSNIIGEPEPFVGGGNIPLIRVEF